MAAGRALAIGCAGIAAAVLTACVEVAQPRPQGIVSIDYCADQMVLGLVDRRRVIAVSSEVDSDTQFSAPLARGIPRVRADLERILALSPRLVVRSYGGGPRLAAALERAGVQVYTLPYAGDVAAIRTGIRDAGEKLDAIQYAAYRLAKFDAQLRSAGSRRSAVPALYLTPGDVTSGPGSLVTELMERAGMVSVERRTGWHKLPVEALIAEPPAIIVRGFFETPGHRQDRWASSGHAALTGALAKARLVDVPGSQLACGNWLAGDALATMTAARAALQ